MSDPEQGEPIGIGEAGRAVARHVSALVSARLELASVEWATERLRIQRRLGLLLAGVLLLVLGTFTLLVLLILFFWESHRMLALLGAGLFCSLSGAYLILWPGYTEADDGLPFAATRAEFDKDRAAFFPDSAPDSGQIPAMEAPGGMTNVGNTPVQGR